MLGNHLQHFNTRAVHRFTGCSIILADCPSTLVFIPAECSSTHGCPRWTIHRSWTIRCTTAAQPELVKGTEDAFELQKACEKVLFYKVFIPSSFKIVTLERLWENQFVCESFTYQRRNDFKEKQVSKSFDLNSFLKMICFTKQRFSKRLWSPNPASRDQP